VRTPCSLCGCRVRVLVSWLWCACRNVKVWKECCSFVKPKYGCSLARPSNAYVPTSANAVCLLSPFYITHTHTLRLRPHTLSLQTLIYSTTACAHALRADTHPLHASNWVRRLNAFLGSVSNHFATRAPAVAPALARSPPPSRCYVPLRCNTLAVTLREKSYSNRSLLASPLGSGPVFSRVTKRMAPSFCSQVLVSAS